MIVEIQSLHPSFIAPKKVRLTHGTLPNSGRLEILNEEGEWNMVCADDTTSETFSVACTEMGYE